MPIDRFDDAVCATCARSATGIGYAPPGKNNAAPLWVCDDPTCLQTAIESYQMKQDKFNGIEIVSCREGLIAGVEYLQTINKSDIYEMSEPEANEYARRMIAGYRKALKSGIENGEAPF